MKISISKSRFLEGLRCPRLLWLRYHHPELAAPLDSTTLHTFEVGHRVGKIAHELFPGGKMIEYNPEKNFSKMVAETHSAMTGNTQVIYEGTFSAGILRCRADIMQKSVTGKKKWQLNEVKMSTKLKKEHISDTAFQCRCILDSGFSIDEVFLTHLNPKYRRKGCICPKDLYVSERITSDALSEAKNINLQVNEFSKIAQSKDQPETIIGSKCNSPSRCQFYDYCHRNIQKSSVYELPYGYRIIPKLIDAGITLLKNIPKTITLSTRQQKLVESVKKQESVVDVKKLSGFLDTFTYPLYFFDFETVSPAIPQLQDSKPYERIPFQYSLHILEKAHGKLVHKEYLHDSRTDPRGSILHALIKDLGNSGSIINWNKSFEESVLKSLAEVFPAFSNEINAILKRIRDLIIPFRSGTYSDYRFKGSASIKAVLPVLCPELSYKSLSVQRGDEASLLFERYLEGTMPQGEWDGVKPGLLSYCKLDTLAMVEIYKKLVSVIDDKRIRKNMIINRKKRGMFARQYIKTVLNNPEHHMYTASDVEFAKKLNVTRLTILNIRKEMDFKGRNNRVTELVQNIDTSKYTIKELSMKLNLKYQNLYKLITKMRLPIRPDKRPIVSMIEYQKQRSADYRLQGSGLSVNHIKIL